MEKYLKSVFLKVLIKIRKNIYTIILFNIILIIISPWLFTRKLNLLDFTATGQIGDTLGGITAPFINVLNAILIYVAFKEQKDANDILRNQVKKEKEKEEERLNDIKKIILYDLEYRIKPSANQLIPETEKCLGELEEEKIKYYTDYIDFNNKIFSSNTLYEYNKIFNKDIEDLKRLITIYGKVDFIYRHSPLQISYKYPTDKNGLKLIHVEKSQKEEIVARHQAKKRIELERLIPNLKHLIDLIDDILTRYK